MKTGILLLNFGEPESTTPEAVTAYLERIFLGNARLDPSSDPDAVRRRARELAERRAPGLMEDYRRIGGSPLNGQAMAQGQRLQAELDLQGRDAAVLVGMQFTEPTIAEVVERAVAGGVERLVALPVYPLSGPSTTMAALQEVRRSLERLGWAGPVEEITGWHDRPAYIALRADGVRTLCAREGLDLGDPATWVVFSAHGTPIQYLDEGSGYDLYVQDHCQALAAAIGVERYGLGFQNHGNRPGVAWTQPEIGQAIRRLDARRIVVVPISFMQEHSETLAELDLELRAEARELGLGFHRVPVPHDDPRFVQLLIDLVAPFLAAA